VYLVIFEIQGTKNNQKAVKILIGSTKYKQVYAIVVRKKLYDYLLGFYAINGQSPA
jgi:hypothetical protein